MVVKEGDTLTLGGQTLKFHLTPGHTPGVRDDRRHHRSMTAGSPIKAIVWGGAGYRGGLADAEQSVQSANKVAQIQGVQVNLQIHSWAEERVSRRRRARARPDAEVPQTRRPAPFRGSGHIHAMGQADAGQRGEGRVSRKSRRRRNEDRGRSRLVSRRPTGIRADCSRHGRSRSRTPTLPASSREARALTSLCAACAAPTIHCGFRASASCSPSPRTTASSGSATMAR